MKVRHVARLQAGVKGQNLHARLVFLVFQSKDLVKRVERMVTGHIQDKGLENCLEFWIFG